VGGESLEPLKDSQQVFTLSFSNKSEEPNNTRNWVAASQ